MIEREIERDKRITCALHNHYIFLAIKEQKHALSYMVPNAAKDYYKRTFGPVRILPLSACCPISARVQIL